MPSRYGAQESGWARSERGTFTIRDVGSQQAALKKILSLVEKGSTDPVVRRTAIQITSDCNSRDDMCELQAIFNAVKHGTDKIRGLQDGLRYIADPTAVDFYTGARRTLMECQIGSCAGDCDDHTILVGSLLASIGFKVGARAWGPDPARTEFTHVYCIVALPKRGPWPASYTGHGMDTTVEKSVVGWEPPKRKALSIWLED